MTPGDDWPKTPFGIALTFAGRNPFIFLIILVYELCEWVWCKLHRWCYPFCTTFRRIAPASEFHDGPFMPARCVKCGRIHEL